MATALQNVLADDNDLRVCFELELSEERCLLRALLVYFSAFLPRPPKRLSSSSSFHSTHDIHPILILSRSYNVGDLILRKILTF